MTTTPSIASLIWPHVHRHKDHLHDTPFWSLYTRLQRANYRPDGLSGCTVTPDELDDFCITVLGRTPADVLGHDTYLRLCVFTGECQNGHKRTPENTHLRPGNKRFKCRDCDRERQAARYQPRPNPVHHKYDIGGECYHGHRLTEDNIYIDTRGARLCLQCKRRVDRESKRRRRARV